MHLFALKHSEIPTVLTILGAVINKVQFCILKKGLW